MIRGADSVNVSYTNSDEITTCSCYEDAYEAAAKSKSLSTAFRTGYRLCSNVLGDEGEQAWTSGWDARKAGRSSKSSCRSFKSSRRS